MGVQLSPMKISEKYEEFIEFLRRDGKTEKTITEYKRFLHGSMSHSIQDMALEALTLNDIVKVKEAGAQHGQFGPQRSVCVVRRYLQWLSMEGIPLPFNWRDIKVPRVFDKDPDALTPEEMEYVMSSIPLDNKIRYRLRALLETLYATGMRISECLAMKIEDIPWEKKELRIKNAKSHREQKVYFTDRSLHWIRQYLDQRADKCPMLFVASHGYAVMHYQTAQSYTRLHFKKVSKVLGKRIHHHLFRRTFVTRLIEGGADIKAVQYLARHESERTTLRNYTAFNKDRAKEFHQVILGGCQPLVKGVGNMVQYPHASIPKNRSELGNLQTTLWQGKVGIQETSRFLPH